MHEMHHELIKVNTAIEGASIQAFVGLKGALLGATQLVKDLTVGFTNAAHEGGTAASAVGLIAAALKGLVAAMVVATALIKEMWAAFSFGAEGAGMWLNEIYTQIRNLGLAMKNLSFAGVKDEWAFFQDQMLARTHQFKKDVTTAITDMFNELHTIFAAGGKKIEDEKKKQDARMAAAGSGGKAAKGNTDALEAARKGIEGEIKALQEGLNFKKTVWDGEVAAHKLSKDQEFANLMQATEREFQAELALLQKEKALLGQKPQQVQEINNKIEQLQARHNLTMVKPDQQALAEETASWARHFQIVTTSFNSQLRGLITGTTSFRNAFRSIMTDMAVKFAEIVENMAVKWAVGQLAETTATQTGAAARAAAQVAGSTASDPGTISAVLRSIFLATGQARPSLPLSLTTPRYGHDMAKEDRPSPGGSERSVSYVLSRDSLIGQRTRFSG